MSRTIWKSRSAARASVSDAPDELTVHVPAPGSFEMDAKPARTTVAAVAGAASGTMEHAHKTNEDKIRGVKPNIAE